MFISLSKFIWLQLVPILSKTQPNYIYSLTFRPLKPNGLSQEVNVHPA